MRIIDADKLKEELDKRNTLLSYDAIKDLIDYQPTVDAVIVKHESEKMFSRELQRSCDKAWQEGHKKGYIDAKLEGVSNG